MSERLSHLLSIRGHTGWHRTRRSTRPGYFDRDALLEDARQLAEILENTHPDPDFSGGGRIAFHRRLQHLLNSIPEAGRTEEEFTRLLIPFVAGLGGGHTVLSGEYSVNHSSPGGIPLHLAVIEEHPYVAGVPSGADASFLGSRSRWRAFRSPS